MKQIGTFEDLPNKPNASEFRVCVGSAGNGQTAFSVSEYSAPSGKAIVAQVSDYDARREGLRLRLGKHFENGLPGFMSKMRRGRESLGALSNTLGVGQRGLRVVLFGFQPLAPIKSPITDTPGARHKAANH